MTIRRAHRYDLPALDAMLARCSIRTTALRFNVPMPRLPRAYAEAIERHRGNHLVMAVHDKIIGLASCIDGELAVLVEDAWQGRGAGTRLLQELTACADRRELTAEVSYGNSRMIRMLKRLAPTKVSSGPDGYRLVMQLATMEPCSTGPTTRRTAPSHARSRSSASAGRS
jgi:GNAT superfamily N-acetyltransferase